MIWSQESLRLHAMTWYTLVKVYSGTFNAHRRTQIGNLARSNPEQRMSRDTCVFCTLVKFWGKLAKYTKQRPTNGKPFFVSKTTTWQLNAKLLGTVCFLKKTVPCDCDQLFTRFGIPCIITIKANNIGSPLTRMRRIQPSSSSSFLPEFSYSFTLHLQFSTVLGGTFEGMYQHK